MTPATARVRLAFASAALLVVCLAGTACDDGPAPKPADPRSVIEGGKAESEAGKQVEHAKERIDDAEKQLEARDEEVFEKSAGEQAGRGVP